MLAKYLAAGLIGSALLAAPALAAETATTNAVQADTTAAAYHGDWRASKMVGLNVYNEKNEKIGSIDDLLMDKSGNIKAAVIGVGGFIGVGERLVAIPFDKIKFSEEPVPSSTASNAPSTGTPNRPASTTTTGSAANSTTKKTNEWYPDHAVFNASKDELQKLPEFKYSS